MTRNSKSKIMAWILCFALLTGGITFTTILKLNNASNIVYAEEYDEEYAEEYDEGEYEDYEENEDNDNDEDESESAYSGSAELQIIQVMAKGKNPLTGELYDMNKFVAGKSTAIRVQFSEEREIEQDGSLILSIYKDDEEVVELLPISGGSFDYAVFAPRNIKDVNSWEAGEYKFALYDNFNEEIASRTEEFSEAKKIKVLMVPVLANYGGQVAACEGEWMTGIQMTRDTYPLADDGIEVVLGDELDCSADMYNLRTNEGRYNVWQALSDLQTPNKDYELILGYVRYRQGENGTTQGYTYGIPANIITESDGDMQPTVAHEIAHCYFVGDEYDGGSMNPMVNPAPFGMEGSHWDYRDQTIQSSREAVERVDTHTGSLVDTNQVPFNTRTMEALQPAGSWMGSGSENMNDYWITSDIWNHLFSAFVDGDATVRPYADDSGLSDKSGEYGEDYDEEDEE